MAKSPAERLARAERRLDKARRKAVEARKAVAPVVKAAPPAVPPGRDFYDETLLEQALAGDDGARVVLAKRGTLPGYVADFRQALMSPYPGMAAWAAGCLAQLDPGFDDQAPLPRGVAR